MLNVLIIIVVLVIVVLIANVCTKKHKQPYQVGGGGFIIHSNTPTYGQQPVLQYPTHPQQMQPPVYQASPVYSTQPMPAGYGQPSAATAYPQTASPFIR